MSFLIRDTNLNTWRKFICCLTTVSALLLWPSVKSLAQAESSQECSFLGSPQEFNTVEDDGKIVIGHIRSRPYTVLLTHDLQEHLPAIRSCVPDAFLTSSRLGSYIHIASFNNYREAKELADQIDHSLALNVRVIHRARLGR